jgi:hypothetical protein
MAINGFARALGDLKGQAAAPDFHLNLYLEIASDAAPDPDE